MPKEVERRQMLLDELSTKEKQLEQVFKNESDTFSGRYVSTMNNSYLIEISHISYHNIVMSCFIYNYRSALFDEGGFGAGTSTGRSTNPFDTDPPDDLSFGDIRQQQQHIIRGKSVILLGNWSDGISRLVIRCFHNISPLLRNRVKT